jgi:hypothetical protein
MDYLYNNSAHDMLLLRKYEKYLNLRSVQLDKKEFKTLQNGDIIVVDGKELNSEYLVGLSREEKERLVLPIFNILRNMGWNYPKLTETRLFSEYKSLCLSEGSLNNNSSAATNICKHFCESFYRVLNKKGKSIVDIWNDDELLKQVIRNRLVLTWESKNDENFNITPRMIIQGMRSMSLAPLTSIFKPTIAKYICERYSEPGDLVGDYSAGFGGRLLGAMSSGRRYFGTDPLTSPELQKMIDFYGFKNCNVECIGSENYFGKENFYDLYWSSPPYYNYEIYSKDKTQAYNNGKEYFFDIYWKNTLLNVRYMLKSGKWFGLNVKGVPRMLEMAKDIFGEPKEYVSLDTKRSHLRGNSELKKIECVYMFKNNK